MTKDNLILLFFISGIIAKIMFCVLQIKKTIKTKNADQISLECLGGLVISSCAYLGYASMSTQHTGIITLGVIDILSCLAVFIVTFFYQCMDKINKRVE